MKIINTSQTGSGPEFVQNHGVLKGTSQIEKVLRKTSQRVRVPSKGPPNVTKPCKFIGSGAMEVTKPYKFIEIGRPARFYALFGLPPARAKLQCSHTGFEKPREIALELVYRADNRCKSMGARAGGLFQASLGPTWARKAPKT
jgi:hypothetical protein